MPNLATSIFGRYGQRTQDLWRFVGQNQPGFPSSGHLSNSLTVDSSGNFAINNDGTTVSAILSLNATDRGFLPPRMTATQTNAIVSPAEGLMVYVTNTGGAPFNFTSKGWWGWDGVTWKQMA